MLLLDLIWITKIGTPLHQTWCCSCLWDSRCYDYLPTQADKQEKRLCNAVTVYNHGHSIVIYVSICAIFFSPFILGKKALMWSLYIVALFVQHMELLSLFSVVSPVVCNWNVMNCGRKSRAPLKYYLIPLITNIGIHFNNCFFMTYTV